MKVVLVFIMCLVLGCAAPYTPTNGDRQLVSTVQQTLPSVFEIRSFSNTQGDKNRIPRRHGVAAGFLVDADKNYVATCFHVVATFDMFSLRVNGHMYFGTVVAYSEVYDVAILKLDRSSNTPALALVSEAVLPGTFVWTIGNPYGDPSTVTFGRVSRDDGLYIYTDTPVNPGNSGGPLLNRQGHVIGLVARTRRGADGMGSAIKIKYLQQLLQSIPETL